MLTIATSLLCGLLILFAGIIYFIDTIRTTKQLEIEHVGDKFIVEDVLKELSFGKDLSKLFLITFLFILIPLLTIDTHSDEMLFACFIVFLITAASESLGFLLKRFSTKTSSAHYYKFGLCVLLGVLNSGMLPVV